MLDTLAGLVDKSLVVFTDGTDQAHRVSAGELHTALAEKIPTPDLLVYLRADLNTLMARIAMRDRPYERGMDRNYIDSLRLAYEGFFTAYTASPVLVIDTNNFNIIADPQAYADVRERIRSALSGTFQQALLQVPAEAPAAPRIEPGCGCGAVCGCFFGDPIYIRQRGRGPIRSGRASLAGRTNAGLC